MAFKIFAYNRHKKAYQAQGVSFQQAKASGLSGYELDFRGRMAAERGDSSLLDLSKPLSASDTAARQRGEANEKRKHNQAAALGLAAVGGTIFAGLSGGASAASAGASSGMSTATKAALIESGTVGSAGAALEASAVGLTPWATPLGGASASLGGTTTTAKTATKGILDTEILGSGITVGDAATGLSAASSLIGPKLPEMPAEEPLPTRESMSMPRVPRQFETRASDMAQRARAAGAIRTESDADLLGARPGVKKRGPARRLLSGY